KIVPHTSDGFYMPYRHWLLQGDYIPDKLDHQPNASFQNGAVSAYIECEADFISCSDSDSLRIVPGLMVIDFEWYTDGSAQGDYKLFVHVYGDVNQPPVAQSDGYPGGGTLPPGDWLPGVLHDTITVDLTAVPSGTYKVAIGLYNPYSN